MAASPEQIALVLAAREHLWAALPRRALGGPHLPPEIANTIHAALAAIQDWAAREDDKTLGRLLLPVVSCTTAVVPDER